MKYDIRPEFQFIDSLINAAYYDAKGKSPNKVFSRKNFYKVWLVYNECKLHFADRSITISSPALIFSNPFIPYSYEGLSNERTGYWCIFKEEYLRVNERIKPIQDSPLFSIAGNNVFLLTEDELTKVAGLFDQIISGLATDYIFKFDEVKNYIKLLIHQGLKLQPVQFNQQLTGPARITSFFLDLLEKQFPLDTPLEPMQLKSPGDFAASIGIHVNHLNYAVKKITGITTREHIAEKMMYEAKGLLKHSNWDVAEIAHALGFSYSNYFNNFFKKHTGITPISFRH